MLYYRLPGEEISIKRGRFVRIDSITDVHGFVVSNFEGDQLFWFREEEEEEGLAFLSKEPASMTKQEYLKVGSEFLERLKQEGVGKAILSRIKKVPYKQTPYAIFKALCERYPKAFVYVCTSPFFGTWVGATPEVLLKEEKGRAHTVALAGTLSTESQESWGAKEREEQDMVRSFISAQLEQLELIPRNGTEVSEVVAGPVKHLCTYFDFELPPEKRSKLITLLHPTPAVCGVPRTAAKKLIEEVETHSRDLYTGFIGLLEKEKVNLFVNLRCAQLKENDAYLYLGGGYTKDSNVLREWEETENKAKTLLSIIENQ